ncbi:hypothetical protein MPSEU_000224000 [Mayamaea pseudoterrestris]|nr:hypothetical protein MPSEU_000224000 [Mayamaea pseudoterrestris]
MNDFCIHQTSLWKHRLQLKWQRQCILLAFLLMFAAVFVTLQRTSINNIKALRHTDHVRRLSTMNAVANAKKQRILYIVTTLAEYNTGTRATVRGSDRLQETLIPVVSEGIQTMIDAGYHVDLFLVCHFVLLPERQALIQSKLPAGVGLHSWSEATPLGYDTGREPFKKLENRTLHLSRQHRFVIKDHLMDYDIFVCFEDDMLITAKHVDHYVAMTNEIERLYELAPDEPVAPDLSNQDALRHYHGVMTKSQLARTIPGWIRVEILLNEEQYGAQNKTGPVPIDLEFGGTTKNVDPSVCCHVSSDHISQNRPAEPESSKLMLWETNIMPLGVRKLPDESWINWVVTQRGPNQGKLNATSIIGDYWTNRNNDYYPGSSRPSGQEFRYINNQGGWMATRQQLWRWHTEICPGGFLPPYEAPHYRYDGLDMRNVEWYSGAMQLSTVRHACNMQRIIMLDPANFSKSLLYHTANNKQKQLRDEGKGEWFVKANTLLGQLNTIRKRAEKDIDVIE